MAGHDKTEKATPKKRAEARKKGQVAKSQDLNGAAVLLAALLALSSFGPGMMRRLAEAMVGVIQLIQTPQVVDTKGLGAIFGEVVGHVAVAAAPVVGVCALAGIVVNVAQVGFKPSFQSLKPDPKKLNPLQGFKSIYGINALAEMVKSLLKISVVGGIVAIAVFPKLDELSALVGMPAADLIATLAGEVLHVAQRAALAYLVIAIADYTYQRWRFEKQLRMDKQEVKDEHKQQELPAEVRGQQRRRAMELARARMMDAVPTADVIVTNPTHFSVALRYSAEHPAPIVVAKGQDLLAFRIRELARDRGIAVVPDPPLARALYASVDVGKMIPEELFQAVAQLLAYVYRIANRRAAAA